MGITPSQPDGLRSWLTAGSYRVSQNVDGRIIKLSDVHAAEVGPYLSYDYERFALSSLESFQVALVEVASHGYVSWPIIKLYYSAFFAAHAIMRLCGTSIIKLEKEHVDFLQSLSDVYVSGGGAIRAGMYQIRFRQVASGSLEAAIERQSDSQGAHEGFWRAFDDFLNVTANEMVNRKSAEASDFVAGVNEIQPMLRPHGTRRSAWISAMRNEVNYQHRHGSWQPGRLERRSSARLASIAVTPSAAVRLDFALDADAAEAFIAVSHYLSSLNVELGNVVAGNSTAARAFGQNWRRLA